MLAFRFPLANNPPLAAFFKTPGNLNYAGALSERVSFFMWSPTLNLVHHIHSGDHRAEDRVLAVQTGLRFQANVKLAAAAFALGIDLVAGACGRQSPAQMLLRPA